jgi:hypothetical protein
MMVMVQEFKEFKEFRSSGVQEFRSSGVQEFRAGWIKRLQEESAQRTQYAISLALAIPAPELLQLLNSSILRWTLVP